MKNIIGIRGRIVAIFAFLLCSVTAMRGADIRGRVIDERSEPLMGAYVGIISLPDSAYLGSAVTEQDGRFLISTPATGECLVTTRLFGYDDNNQILNLPDSAPLEIHMQPTSAELKELVVEGRAPKLTHEAGKFSFTPGALRDFASNSFDLIKLTPMVESGHDNVLGISGKGTAIIYINGRDPHMPMAGIIAELKTYPPSAVKRVEVITDPGATVSGNKGIINIIVEYPYEGFIGSVTANGSFTNGQVSVNPDFWFGYRRGRWSVSANAIYQRLDYSQSNRYIYDYTKMPLRIENDIKTGGHGNGFNVYATLQYEISKRSTVGITAFTAASSSTYFTRTTTLETRNGIEQETYYTSRQKYPWGKPSASAMAFYTLKTDDNGSGLDITANYSYVAPKNNNFTEDFNGRLVNEIRNNSYNGASAKAEYKQRFTPLMELIGGYEIVWNNSFDCRNSPRVADNYHYRKLINTVYAQFNARFGKKFSLRAGLRLENMHDVGRQKAEDLRFSHNYTFPLPSLSLGYDLPRSQSISLSLSKGFFRPWSYLYNPYKNWTSDNSYETGNPDIKPSQSVTATLTYTFPWGLTLETRYSYNWDSLCQLEMPGEDGVSVLKPRNYGHSNSAHLGAYYNKLLTSFWNLGLTGAVFYNNLSAVFMGYNNGYDNWSGVLTWRNNFTVPGGWYGSFTCVVRTPSSEGLAKMPWQYSLGMTVQKSFKFGLNLSLDLDLPLGRERGSRYYETAEYKYRKLELAQEYLLTFNVSYTFGKRTVKPANIRPISQRN